MKRYSLSHLADHILLRDFAALHSDVRAKTADFLAHLAEVDERKLYLPAAYPSMFAYCVQELHLSEDAAFRRLRAARTARQFPQIFPALADGRLNLNAVLMLTPHLTPETADGLLAAAAHKTKAEIELLLARRFPQPDLATGVRALSATSPPCLLDAQPIANAACQLAPAPVGMTRAQHESGNGEPPTPRARVAPIAPERFALQVTIGQATHDKLRYAQALLGHVVAPGDVAQVLDRALDALIHQLEQRRFAATSRSRPRRSAANGRYVPAEVRRTVWQRDGGQCTFVSEKGKRCEARSRLEFDHVDPVARGGQTTADRMRLRCRAHNQYAAECVFGRGFMREKRQEARCRATQERARSEAGASQVDVIPWLRQLGFSAGEARRGAALCAHLPGAPLEERVRVALRGLAPACVRWAANGASNPA